MNGILKRDLLDSSMPDRELMQKHKIYSDRLLRRLFIEALGFKLRRI